MDSKLKSRIISALRKLTYGYKPRTEAQNAQKVGPASYQCEGCEAVLYTGKRPVVPAEVLEKYPNAVHGKVYLDHKMTVVDPTKGWEGWDTYIERMFCEKEGYQCICKPCHDEKSFLEKELRKETRRRNKK